MPRKKSKAVLEDNGPVPQDAYVILGGVIPVEIRRVMSEALDTLDKSRKTRRR